MMSWCHCNNPGAQCVAATQHEFDAQALESGHLKPGARVLVHAGAGGVGHFAVQLAKVHFKAYVVSTAGPANLKFIKEVSLCQSGSRMIRSHLDLCASIHQCLLQLKLEEYRSYLL